MTATSRAQATVGHNGAPPSAADFLARLRDAHSRLLTAMDALDQITRMPLPDRPLYTNARWRISAASLARRALWKECFAYLLPAVDETGRELLGRLNATDVDLLHHSAVHVARWPSDAVEGEWSAYCSSSRLIRTRMLAAITAEKRLLYPLLATHARGFGPGFRAATPAAANGARTNRSSR